MRKLKVCIDFGTASHTVGTLYLSEKMGRYMFSYDKGFLGTGLEISPKNLPLQSDTYAAERNPDLYDLHGVFADSLPDTWGKKVQDIEFEKLGVREITALERLAFIGRSGIGALKYEPAQEFEIGNEIVKLSNLRKAAQMILSGTIEKVTEELLHCGGSAGGARPKFLIDLDRASLKKIRYTRGFPEGTMFPFIIKVPLKNQDHWQRIEYVYSLLAKESGIVVPDTYLLTGSKSGPAHFAIKRFDITKEGARYHAHTFAGLLGINFRESSLDYSILLRTTQKLTNDHRNVVEIYRRMAFNYLGHNKDDHAKNFTFLMDSKGAWSISPAYDMGYSGGENGLHQLSLNGKRRNAETIDFEAVAGNFEIKQWREILRETCSCLSRWKSLSKKFGVPEKYSDAIDKRIKENIKRIQNDVS